MCVHSLNINSKPSHCINMYGLTNTLYLNDIMCVCVHSLIINNTPSQYIYDLTNILYLKCVCVHSLIINSNPSQYIYGLINTLYLSQQLCMCVYL